MENTIERFFTDEAERVLSEVPKGDFTFALVTDSHLSDTRDQTCANIRYMDDKLHYRCLLHLGDFLCGSIPDIASRRLLREELAAYRSAVANGKLYVAQGNHDGYCDENYRDGIYGQHDMAIDEIWYEATKFMDESPNMVRPDVKPYFYVDFSEEKLRFIVLCSMWYRLNRDYRVYRKIYGLSREQIDWMAREALCVPGEGWNVIVFSHITGMPRTSSSWLSGGKEVIDLLNAFRNGGSVLIDDVSYKFEYANHNVLAWCAGDGHGDMTQKWEGINFTCTASQLPTVPVTWEQPRGYFPAPRVIGAASQDAWDTITWVKSERKLVFTRFGAGENRTIYY